MDVISFARGVPAPECLPVEELAECAKAALERDGTRVLVEAPTYDRPIKILRRLGAEIVGLPMDDDGLDVDALEQALRDGEKPAFLYTIATFQNPSGRTLSEERRRRIAALAQEHDLLVLEDDPYGLVRYDGSALPSIFELSGGERVAYASSFSKTVAPGVRVGYFVLPAELAKQIEALATSTYISPPYLTQATVHEFVRRGNFEPNLQRVNGLLKARRDAMLAALERHMPDGATWSRPEGGYFVWLDLPNEAPTVAQDEKAGVTFVAGTDFFADGSGGNSLRLAFSYVSPDEIAAGVERLAAVSAGAPATASTL